MSTEFHSLIQSKEQIVLNQIPISLSLNFSTFSGHDRAQVPSYGNPFFFFFGRDIQSLAGIEAIRSN